MNDDEIAAARTAPLTAPNEELKQHIVNRTRTALSDANQGQRVCRVRRVRLQERIAASVRSVSRSRGRCNSDVRSLVNNRHSTPRLPLSTTAATCIAASKACYCREQHSCHTKTRSSLLDADDNKDSSNLSPTSYFYKGQRVMITENLATSLGAANGAQGTIVAIKHAAADTRQQQRVQLIEGIAPVMTMCDPLPDVVLVQLRSTGAPLCSLANLPPNVFPVLPVKKTFTTKFNNSKSLTVKLSQFPLVPTSAITVHKVQGQSMDRVIITKWRDPKMASQYPTTAYVELSRVRKLDGLYITHLLTKADREFFVPPLAVIDELERLDKLQPPHLRSSDDVLRARRAPAEARALQLQQQQSSKKRKR
jgi:hypothetical protein